MTIYALIKTEFVETNILKTFTSDLLLISSKYDTIIKKKEEIERNIEKMHKNNNTACYRYATEIAPNNIKTNSTSFSTPGKRYTILTVTELALPKPKATENEDQTFKVGDFIAPKSEHFAYLREKIGDVPELSQIYEINEDGTLRIRILKLINQTSIAKRDLYTFDSASSEHFTVVFRP